MRAAVAGVQVTQEFLDFTAAQGNDLQTPRPPMFPGLKPGDRWCLCASRCAASYIFKCSQFKM